MVRTYDVIVLGLGGIGSAVLRALAQRGIRVLGVDRFHPPHDRGSSHGTTRIIRQAYFEHPDYVPLARRAYRLWSELEAERSETLFHRVGVLQIGPSAGRVIRGVLRSAEQHGLAVDVMNVAEVERRYPLLRVPETGSEMVGVLERDAGYLLVEQGVATMLASAEAAGAERLAGIAVTDWRASRSGVAVETGEGTFEAATLVLAPGPWAPALLRDAAIPLRVLRKHLHWTKAPSSYRASRGFPGFLFELPEGVFYGFPSLDDAGVKVAEHSGGEPVDDPGAASREADRGDIERVARFVSQCLPGLTWNPTRHAVCFYTMTPDEHFVVGRLPTADQVFLAAGFSGHGYKFAPAIGELLADLVINHAAGGQDASDPILFLSPRRFAADRST